MNNTIGNQIYQLIEKLFPICRSITGNGVRETLNILQSYIDLKIHEIPSGKKIFDWIIPNEWNINDAYIIDGKGKKIIDFKKNNLHVMGYSEPFEGKVNLSELNKHLYSLPDQPDLIPYVTSYYNRDWGFCLSDNQRKNLLEDVYTVKIDSSLKHGSLTYADLIIKGQSKKEIIFSTYICHPSLANNELSGPAVTTFLAKYYLEHLNNYYTYRFIYVPETIGSLTYISNNLNELKNNVYAGYVITCIGDNGPFSYLQTRRENTIVDRVTMHVLKNTEKEYRLYNYLSRGSDERQYGSPGIDLPVGSLMRTKYGEYPEYHTSADNLNILTPFDLEKSLTKLKLCVEVLEKNKVYKTTVLGEPQLGKRGLYPNISMRNSSLNTKTIRNLLAYCDGENDLLWVAEKIGKPIISLFPMVDRLLKHNLLEKMD